jgi:hypothetical protein
MLGGDGCFEFSLLPSLMQLSRRAAQMAFQQKILTDTAGDI